MSIEQTTAIIQAGVAVLTLGLSGIAIWLGLMALRYSRESISQIKDQLTLAEAQALGSMPRVVNIQGYSRPDTHGLLISIADVAAEQRFSALRNVELLDESGAVWAHPDHESWAYVRLSRDAESVEPIGPLSSNRIPLLSDQEAIAMYFPLPHGKSIELEDGEYSPIMGATMKFPAGVAIRISWEDALGNHAELMPQRLFKYNQPPARA